MRDRWAGLGRRGTRAALAVVAVSMLAAPAAVAHVERASYWPDPKPDTSITPAAGGKVPAVRSLYSALDAKPPGETHVVCQGSVPSPKRVMDRRRALRSAREDGASERRIRALKRRLGFARKSYARRARSNGSIRRLRRMLAQARTEGYKLRPSEGARKVSRRQAARLLDFNVRLLQRCRYKSIQRAVTAAGNNDRVVIMPGVYIEPESRAKPTHDPDCAHLRQQNDEGADDALSYEYQFNCPNDQNLIAVMGRRPGAGKDPQPPLWDRHGIPNLGPCVRCNVQIEGSGVGPDDVVIDAGRVKSGNAGPIEPVKDVVIRADRADGFVLRNVTTRHAAEHNIYVLESDGFVLERFKTYYAGEYGVLTFVEDHGLIQDCEAKGHGDAGLYPGAAADTGEQTIEPKQRYNQEVRFCDSHHNAAGYSGTTGNAVHVHHNRFYDNALGLTTDVFTASGHPGFPSDSILIEDNEFYSNNFNPYAEGSDVKPTVPLPVGTGMWIAGGNNNTIRNNRFWDNWRRGTMVFSVPDAFVCGPAAGGNEQAGCDPSKVSTSHRNRHYGNTMGIDRNGKKDPNGTDFWWDQFQGNENNCWYDNTGKDGTRSSVTSDPQTLPSDCATSRGNGGPAQEQELLNCLGDMTFDTNTCPWFTTPPEPKT